MPLSKSVQKRLEAQCGHARIEKCLYTGGQWWNLCLTCSLLWAVDDDGNFYFDRLEFAT